MYEIYYKTERGQHRIIVDAPKMKTAITMANPAIRNAKGTIIAVKDMRENINQLNF